MITWIRSANINHGKHGEAISWAIRVSDYVNNKFGTHVTVHGNVAGPVNQIHWIGTFESLSAFETITGQIASDEDYNKFLAESSAANLFDTHSFVDTLYNSLG